jgi:hypothetical protein
MIDVPFYVDVRYTPNEFLKEHILFFPWLDFLYKNRKHLFITSRYDPGPHWFVVNYRFYLDEKIETFYKLKYSH